MIWGNVSAQAGDAYRPSKTKHPCNIAEHNPSADFGNTIIIVNAYTAVAGDIPDQENTACAR